MKEKLLSNEEILNIDVIDDIQLNPSNEFENLVQDYIDKCGYTRREAEVEASKVMQLG